MLYPVCTQYLVFSCKYLHGFVLKPGVPSFYCTQFTQFFQSVPGIVHSFEKNQVSVTTGGRQPRRRRGGENDVFTNDLHVCCLFLGYAIACDILQHLVCVCASRRVRAVILVFA